MLIGVQPKKTEREEKN